MYNQSINLAVRQAQRWIRAAEQDRDPRIAFLHASYAVATIDLIRQLWSDADVQRITGARMIDLHAQASSLQDRSASRIRTP